MQRAPTKEQPGFRTPISGPWIGNRLMAVIKELGLCRSQISSLLRLSFRQTSHPYKNFVLLG